MVKAKVVFPYTAENEDELSLEEGQVIFVLDQVCTLKYDSELMIK